MKPFRCCSPQLKLEMKSGGRASQAVAAGQRALCGPSVGLQQRLGLPQPLQPKPALCNTLREVNAPHRAATSPASPGRAA